MYIISHRGNIDGPRAELENKPDYIEKAMTLDFAVEVDVWLAGNKLYLGHCNPDIEIEPAYLTNPKFWCHAKNIDALQFMLDYGGIHCFYHQTDDVTLTSKGYIWTFPTKKLFKKSICVLPELTPDAELHHVAGVCTDFPLNYSY